MAFLKNIWYVAAWDDEVAPGRMLNRRLLGQAVLLFRDADGTVRAIADRCPHRFAPLHRGTLKDGAVHCAYHGLAFDGRGACVLNPHGDGTIPKAAKVTSYPVVERHSAVWIWMGDSALADPALITDFSCMDKTAFHVGKRYLHVKANYQLETDNIMDLSHIEYLHAGTLGSDAVKRAALDVAQDGDVVWSKRVTRAERLTPYLEQAMGVPPGQLVDRWLDVRWTAPSNMLLLAGATATGRPREEGRETPTIHLFTPETETTTHYWFAISFPQAMGEMGKAMAEEHIEGLSIPFATEDLPMLEAQQQSMGDSDFWALKPILLAGDGGAVRARRVMDRMLKEEAATATVAA
ncbi:aromatic ring-hydroxylating dioxygenase subunit alpha [Azospirillum sp. B4]|uniref:aromatic ring-hydroxylating dioxygenase subunit alpha n=1 Tax=Azospirillum sp. B4 TaxID=95605 RepID=UPI000346E8CD|nr:aromatic ring-hydroxylating dioxygenase subunit alpha [Azospirillum sp. B4]